MPLTILVAEDDLATRLAINDYLNSLGYSVITADDGEQALAMVQSERPYLVITDVAMPRMDGYQLVRQMRQHPATRLLPVIFLTAYADTPDRIRGYQVGVDAYLSKPFELAELGAIVRNQLERMHIVETEWRFLRQEGATPAGPPPVPEDRRLMLTEREKEVLRVLVEGLSNSQIGDRLHLSPRTIEKYVSSLLRKTATNNRAELVRFAIEHQLLN